MIKKSKNKSLGFTLIELLVVIAIIGVLSTIVLASLKSARERARDANRLSDLKQIETALSLYYNDYGYFPKTLAHTENDSGGCGGYINWCGDTNSLKTFLAPYYALPTKYGDGFDKSYYYKSSPGDNYQTYGVMIVLESSSNSSKETNDGGYYSWAYEVGFMPKYCQDKYGTGWFAGYINLCPGGN